jgi:hypothetical protein
MINLANGWGTLLVHPLDCLGVLTHVDQFTQ